MAVWNGAELSLLYRLEVSSTRNRQTWHSSTRNLSFCRRYQPTNGILSEAKEEKTIEEIKKKIYQYLTAFQLVILLLSLMISFFGMPDELISGKTAVYIVVALVAAFVYSKDKNTSVDLKKIDLTPQQEFQIKSVVEWLLKLLGYSATVEKIPTPTTVIPVVQPDDYLLARLTAAADERENMKSDISNITELVKSLVDLVGEKNG